MSKILVIEDNPAMAVAFQEALTAEGFEVFVISDGAAAVSSVQETAAQLVILDLQVAGVNVSELIPQLRAQSGNPALPIIALGNNYDRKSVDEAWEAGITNCLYKSNCAPHVLVAAINDALASEQQLAMLENMIGEAEAVAAHAAAHAVDAAAREEVRALFLKEIPQSLLAMRPQLMALMKADDASRGSLILELKNKAAVLAANAGLAEVKNLADLASALEALLKDLHEKPKKVSPSALRTIALAIDFLGLLAQNPVAITSDFTLTASVLAVDDEPFSRRAVTEAISRAGLKCTPVESPEAALALLEANSYDLAVLDIDMPGMTGIELCRALRTLPLHKNTPVIFVTSMTDFDSRAKSTLVGGSDLIAKPFALMELAVKALIYVQKYQMKK